MRFFRNHIIFRFVGWFMAVYILNFSVDSPDSQADHMAEDLSINDMESVAEIILEEWMEIENAIPEHDESDANDVTITLKKSFDGLCIVFKKEPAHLSNLLSNSGFLVYQKNFYQQIFPEFTPPPPKA